MVERTSGTRTLALYILTGPWYWECSSTVRRLPWLGNMLAEHPDAAVNFWSCQLLQRLSCAGIYRSMKRFHPLEVFIWKAESAQRVWKIRWFGKFHDLETLLRLKACHLLDCTLPTMSFVRHTCHCQFGTTMSPTFRSNYWHILAMFCYQVTFGYNVVMKTRVRTWICWFGVKRSFHIGNAGSSPGWTLLCFQRAALRSGWFKMQRSSKVHKVCSIRKERVTWVKDMILECIAHTDSEETLQLNFDPFDTDRRLTLSIMSQAQTQQLKIMTCSHRTQEYMHCKGPWFIAAVLRSIGYRWVEPNLFTQTFLQSQTWVHRCTAWTHGGSGWV